MYRVDPRGKVSSNHHHQMKITRLHSMSSFRMHFQSENLAVVPVFPVKYLSKSGHTVSNSTNFFFARIKFRPLPFKPANGCSTPNASVKAKLSSIGSSLVGVGGRIALAARVLWSRGDSAAALLRRAAAEFGFSFFA